MTATERLLFLQPYQTQVVREEMPAPGRGQVLVAATVSAISAGTELLFYRGEAPQDMAVDATIDGLTTAATYPLAYGYAVVGVISALGAGVAPSWLGRRVFAFHPHAAHFLADPAGLHPIPDGVSDEQAVFLPNMETAVNFVQDARPLIGEEVLIFGQGVVGLLTLHLLRQFPLASITVVDSIPARRSLALAWGADRALTPDEARGAGLDPDLILEVSSNPAALRTAIHCARYGTRILVGSWYGDKPATLDLGGHFHRNRVELFSSQVSTVDARLSHRWDKARRLRTAWCHLHDLPVADLVTHRLPLRDAAAAYERLDRSPQSALQVLFVYPPNEPVSTKSTP